MQTMTRYANYNATQRNRNADADAMQNATNIKELKQELRAAAESLGLK